MTQLLVSVRNAIEAEAALAGGAHVIDVKEPSRGSLGRADDTTMAEVVRVVGGRRPVSAALGELQEWGEWPKCMSHLQFVKWGLSTYRLEAEAAWWKLWREARHVRTLNPTCEVVTVAYADARQANSPDVDFVCNYLARTRQGVLLLDTFEKNGRTLLDWFDETKIAQIVERCQTAGIRIALAGSLGFDEIRALKYLQPDWFAVRGAACQGQQRNAAIDADRVRQLVELIETAR